MPYSLNSMYSKFILNYFQQLEFDLLSFCWDMNVDMLMA